MMEGYNREVDRVLGINLALLGVGNISQEKAEIEREKILKEYGIVK